MWFNEVGSKKTGQNIGETKIQHFQWFNFWKRVAVDSVVLLSITFLLRWIYNIIMGLIDNSGNVILVTKCNDIQYHGTNIAHLFLQIWIVISLVLMLITNSLQFLQYSKSHSIK